MNSDSFNNSKSHVKSKHDFNNIAHSNFERAFISNFQLFSVDFAQSSPLNASPYLTDMANFRATLAEWPLRLTLLDKLDAVLSALRRHGVMPGVAMIGGSFLNRDNHAPGDIDGLLFYTAPNGLDQKNSIAVAAVLHNAKRNNVDIKMVPIDGDPMIAIKVSIYFSNLYSMGRGGSRNMRGVVLVTLD